MKKLYMDCSNGVSGDMILKGLKSILDQQGVALEDSQAGHNHGGHHHEDGHQDDGQHHHEADGHHRSYNDVKRIIEGSNYSDSAKEIARDIYEVIAKAEAQVHQETLETVHFHEVGRDEAISNALNIGEMLTLLGFGKKGDEESGIFVSHICDGTGFVNCAHGKIPVPVPAVSAIMKENSQYDYRTCQEVKTEMVTPSGLGTVVGIKSIPSKGKVEGRVIAQAEARGTRETGRPGLKIYLIEE